MNYTLIMKSGTPAHRSLIMKACPVGAVLPGALRGSDDHVPP
jgi:hypothetical protein